MTTKITDDELDAAKFLPRYTKDDPHSREYAIQTLYCLRTSVDMLAAEEGRIRHEVEIIDKYQHWKVLGYENREAMLEAEVGIKRDETAAEEPIDTEQISGLDFFLLTASGDPLWLYATLDEASKGASEAHEKGAINIDDEICQIVEFKAGKLVRTMDVA